MSNTDKILQQIELMEKQIEAIARWLNIKDEIPQDETTPDA
jgi:hypothetical protein